LSAPDPVTYPATTKTGSAARYSEAHSLTITLELLGRPAACETILRGLAVEGALVRSAAFSGSKSRAGPQIPPRCIQRGTSKSRSVVISGARACYRLTRLTHFGTVASQCRSHRCLGPRGKREESTRDLLNVLAAIADWRPIGSRAFWLDFSHSWDLPRL
jgi:hypothetical protein